MKKIIVILAILFSVSVVSAQTWEKQKENNKKEQAILEKRLDDLNNKIYYLKKEVSEINDSRKGVIYNNKKVKKDKEFKDEELKMLEKQKNNLLASLAKLDSAYYATNDKQINKETDDLPERMGSVELRQRNRAQFYRASAGLLNGNSHLFKGVLVNYKEGKGELATFNIIRTDIGGTPVKSYVLQPKDKLELSLLAGSYNVEVACGSFKQVYSFIVNPLNVKTFAGQDVYWAAYKALSDY